MLKLANSAKLLSALDGCTSWDDIHAKWASFSKEDKGARFEDLTQAFLQVHETYAKEFVNIWRPDEVPAAVAKKLKLRVPEWGIDLVGETRSGEFWSIQCKYRQDTDQELTHNDISSSVATTFESSRGFSYLLVCTTTQRVTNHYDHNPKVLFYGLPMWQQIDAAFLDTLRSKLAGKKVALTPYSPRKHQINAIQDGLKHFKEGKAARGKLIMPCGTGKSLTAWFLSQALGSKRIVIAVPSLSLVKQTLGVWTREAYHNNVDVKWLCVCSDETAGRAEQDDIAVKVKDLGVPCHTSPDAIARELKNNEHNLTVVFTTYQSGQVLATAARKAKYAFDLGIMDEAHKTVGDGDKLFSHLIHDHNIEIRQRVFMTATERRFSGSSDKILSMDDPEVYGETFHLLTFKKAMEVVEGERPILCDYNVITIGVSRQEVKELIQKNLFVRPDSGKWDEDMEADMLAAMVALRKAMQEYPIKHAVSFHGSIKRAEQFREYNDSFTEEFPSFGPLSTFHVSGQTPTGTRSNIIKQFAQADRALVTNARCLTEGVDVPSIDCVLFADPKKSKVDIVQAVGRALRPAQGKKLGYVILPVLHDEDSGELKESAAFKEVIEMLAKLASQDERIIDEFRTISQGQRPTGSSRVFFEFGERISANINIAQFTGELKIKCWSRLAKLSWRPFQEARNFTRKIGLRNFADWVDYCAGKKPKLGNKPADIPSNPAKNYSGLGWKGYGDWLGTGNVSTRTITWLNFDEARDYAQKLELESGKHWRAFCRGEMPEKGNKPQGIPNSPWIVYENAGWQGMADWLGTFSDSERVRSYMPKRSYMDFEKAREYARGLKLKSRSEWEEHYRFSSDGKSRLPVNIPTNPNVVYGRPNWKGWGDWLGTGNPAPGEMIYSDFTSARTFARSLKLKSSKEWLLYCIGKYPKKEPKPKEIPSHPDRKYKDSGWESWGDWLGTGNVSRHNRPYRDFKSARAFVQKLGLSCQREWIKYSKGLIPGKPPKPSDIPSDPNQKYRTSGWVGMSDWLGKSNPRLPTLGWLRFEEAKKVVHGLMLKSQSQWFAYCKGTLKGKPLKPDNIPYSPNRKYKNKGWINWGDWLGTGNTNSKNKAYLGYTEAREITQALRLRSVREWNEYIRKDGAPEGVPSHPDRVYSNSGWKNWYDWLGNLPKSDRRP